MFSGIIKNATALRRWWTTDCTDFTDLEDSDGESIIEDNVTGPTLIDKLNRGDHILASPERGDA